MDDSKALSGYEPYYTAIRSTLLAACSLINAPSGVVERQNMPEVETREAPEMLLNPVHISKDKDEVVLIEPSFNSVRISVKWRKADATDQLLTHMYSSFMAQRADRFLIIRRKPVPGWDISFLITNTHVESMLTHKLVDWVIEFLQHVRHPLCPSNPHVASVHSSHPPHSLVRCTCTSTPDQQRSHQDEDGHHRQSTRRREGLLQRLRYWWPCHTVRLRSLSIPPE